MSVVPLRKACLLKFFASTDPNSGVQSRSTALSCRGQGLQKGCLYLDLLSCFPILHQKLFPPSGSAAAVVVAVAVRILLLLRSHHAASRSAQTTHLLFSLCCQLGSVHAVSPCNSSSSSSSSETKLAIAMLYPLHTHIVSGQLSKNQSTQLHEYIRTNVRT